MHYYVAYYKGTETIAVEATSYDTVVSWWYNNNRPALAVYDESGKQSRLGQW